MLEINHDCNQFIYKDETYLLSKTDLESDEYGLLVLARSDLKHAYIDCNIKTVGVNAFGNCKNLSSIEFPINSKLQLIDDYVFCACKLENFLFPSHVSVISEYSLVCDSDTSIKLAENSELQLIKNCAFGFNNDDVTLPQYVMRIGDSSFNKIKSLKFDENTKSVIISICVLMFSDIECLTLPSGIIEFEDGWCKSVPKLTKLNVPKSNIQYVYFDNTFLLKKSNPKNYDNFDCIFFVNPIIRSVTIPSFIKRISSYSFNNCSSLYKVIFHENSEINTIDDQAFCLASITSFVFHLGISKFSISVFNNCYTLQIIEIQKHLNDD